MTIGAVHTRKIVAWVLAVAVMVLVTTLVVSGQFADQSQAGRGTPQATAGEGFISPTSLTLEHGRDLPDITVDQPF